MNLKPLKYPEFVGLGMLVTMIGLFLAAAAWMTGGSAFDWLLPALLIVSGIALLFKSVVGIALFAVLLTLSLYNGMPRLLGANFTLWLK